MSIEFRSETGDPIRLEDAQARRLATALWEASLSPGAASVAAGILHELHRDNALRSPIELTPRQTRTVLEALEKLD